MTDDLVLTARFPLGVYQGAGADGAGQAFPAPSRLAAALLSVCGSEGVEVVRELFDAAPPVIEHPDVTPGVPSTWWRPQSGRWREEFDVNAQTANGRIEGKPLPFAAYGDEAVWYRWAGLGRLTDALRPVVSRVPYLGRATGPVVLRAERAATPPGPVGVGRVRLTPADRGGVQVTVPTPELLVDLEAAHRSRLELDEAGFDLPVPIVRAEASYTSTVGAVGPDLRARRSSDWRAIDAHVSEDLTSLILRSPVAADSVDVCCQWVERTTGADAVIPVTDRAGVLRSVLVDRQPRVTESVSAATFAGTVDLDVGVPGQVTASQRSVGAALLGTSILWVSATGIDPDDEATGRALLDAVAEATGQAVVGCATSSAPRDRKLPDLAATGRQYLTVQLGSPVTGPVRARLDEVHGGRALHFLAVDPKTGALL